MLIFWEGVQPGHQNGQKIGDAFQCGFVNFIADLGQQIPTHGKAHGVAGVDIPLTVPEQAAGGVDAHRQINASGLQTGDQVDEIVAEDADGGVVPVAEVLEGGADVLIQVLIDEQPDGQRTGLTGAHLVDLVQQGVHVIQQRFEPPGQVLTGGGELDGTVGTLKELGPQLVLQGGHLAAHRRLGDVLMTGRLGKAHILTDG